MKRVAYILEFTIGFLLLSVFYSCSKVDFSVEQIVNPKYEQFNSEIETYLSEKKFQGAVLIGKKDKIVFAKGYGPCDIKNSKSKNITINSNFEIGSITKEMTAAAIMQLVEKKQISLDDPIINFFPEYKYGDKITVEMLLNMRSGIIDCINSSENFFPKKLHKQIEKNEIANKPLDNNLVLRCFYDAPLLMEPGSTYFYSNTNYYLLAKIIEQVSNQTYEEYLQQNILLPCGMSNTNLQFQMTDTKGYDWKHRYYSIPSELAFGCGSVNSSVVDLYKWEKAFTNGKIVSKKSFKKMTDTNSYGYGVNVQNDEVFHSGITNVFNSHCTFYPKSKVYIIVLINKPVTELNSTSISRDIYKIFDKCSLKI